MHPSAERVQHALEVSGFQGQVVELEASTRTAIEAAQAAGCEVGQIVKSLIFLFSNAENAAQKAVLLLVSGSNRVHEKRLGHLLGGKLTRASAENVYEISGFAIGGIPPIGHKTPIPTFIDEDLLQYNEIWAAAGTPNAVFKISPNELVAITNCKVVNVK